MSNDPVNGIDPSGLRNNCPGYDMNREFAQVQRNRLADLLNERKNCDPEAEEQLDKDIDEARKNIKQAEADQRRANDDCNADPTSPGPKRLSSH